ncbi:MAG: protein phosphatase 2C domain-containing protein [Burkholderiaceae bacterium]
MAEHPQVGGQAAAAAVSGALRITACTGQHIGDRAEQQDRVGIFTSRRLPGSALFIVADGMGGKTGGAMAAQQVMGTAKNLFEEYSIGESIQSLLTEIVREAHLVIRLSALSTETEPHSTIAALVVQPHRADWAHVGDSRIYRFREGKLLGRTMDHSYVEQLVSEGKLDRKSASMHRLSNLLTHALGTNKQPSIDFGSTETLAAGDTFFVCTDGLWHYVTDSELALVLATYPVRQASERLIHIARERAEGSGDNCTLAIVRMESLATPAPLGGRELVKERVARPPRL